MGVFLLKGEIRKSNQFNQYIMSKFTYKEQHAVIVRCKDEDDQKRVFEELKKRGFNDLKIVSV